MKRLTLNKWHEKVVLAVIILSCGFVLQAEPPAGQMRAKAGPSFAHAPRTGHAAVSKAHQARYYSKAEKIRYQEETR